MKAVVVGLGNFGTSAALGFARAGVETIALDVVMAPVEQIKDQVDHAVCTDAAAPGSLEAQGCEEADFLVAAIGDDFESQILTIVQARQIGVHRIVARALSDAHRRVLEAVGADVVINPDREAAQAMVLRLLAPDSGERVPIAEGLIALEVPSPPGMAGRTLGDQRADLLQLHGLHLIALRGGAEGERELRLDPDARIEEGDLLLCVGSEETLAKALGG